MSTPTALHEAIEKAIVDHCAGGDLWLCAHIASEPFDARIAELERERDELRGRLSEAHDFARFIVRNEEDVTPRRAMIVQCEEIARLRKLLDEYEQEPTVALLEWPAKSWPNLRLVSGAYATSGTSVELIARPTRKGE